MNKNPLIVALDVSEREKALSLVNELSGYVSIFKIGPVLFTRYGPAIVGEINSTGARVFLDLKLHDIPNTVASTIKALCELDIAMFTVHISGGKDMLKAAVDALKPCAGPRPKILGVTILTSVAEAPIEEVTRLVELAMDTGLDGVVASPLEIEAIRKRAGRDFLIVTPGIRPKGHGAGDQRRTATPKEAVRKGADYIVVGRPIIENSQPEKTARQILSDIGLAL